MAFPVRHPRSIWPVISHQGDGYWATNGELQLQVGNSSRKLSPQKTEKTCFHANSFSNYKQKETDRGLGIREWRDLLLWNVYLESLWGPDSRSPQVGPRRLFSFSVGIWPANPQDAAAFVILVASRETHSMALFALLPTTLLCLLVHARRRGPCLTLEATKIPAITLGCHFTSLFSCFLSVEWGRCHVLGECLITAFAHKVNSLSLFLFF